MLNNAHQLIKVAIIGDGTRGCLVCLCPATARTGIRDRADQCQPPAG